MSAQPFEPSFSIVTPDTYVTACPSCSALADASQSPWCDCVTKERTPVCEACGECRCKRPAKERLEFRMRAPKSLMSLFKQPAPQLTIAPALKAPLVMLVDDDEEIRLIGSHVIRKLGYRCITAGSGPEALVMVAGEQPAVVITDALMPKMDGRDLCRFIKKSSDAKVVIMTALYTAPHYKYEAFKSYGADGYLAKPIDFTALQSTLERLMA
jgi:CheY-like chemotaxis protein